jgi:hypothetical protein
MCASCAPSTSDVVAGCPEPPRRSSPTRVSAPRCHGDETAHPGTIGLRKLTIVSVAMRCHHRETRISRICWVYFCGSDAGEYPYGRRVDFICCLKE